MPSSAAAWAMAPLAVKLIAGNGARGERRDAAMPSAVVTADVLGLYASQVPDPGMSSRTAGDVGPESSSSPSPVGRPGPGNVTAGPADCVSALAWWLP